MIYRDIAPYARKQFSMGSWVTKPVCKFGLDWEFIQWYESLTEAAKSNKLPKWNLSMACNGSHGYRACGKFQWRYAQECEKIDGPLSYTDNDNWYQ